MLETKKNKGMHEVANAFCQLDAMSAVTNSIRAHPPGPNCSKKAPNVSALRPFPAQTTRRSSWSTTTVR